MSQAADALRVFLDGLGRTDGVVDPDRPGRETVFRFAYEGRTWAVHADDRIARLVEFAAALDAGTASERLTDGGMRALWDGRIDGLYIYETGAATGDARPGGERQQPVCSLCFLQHPPGSCD